MRVWLVRAYEPLPTIDGTGRYLRYGMLARALTDRGHQVFWWTSNFDHVRKQSRLKNPPVTIEMWPGFKIRLLPAREYKKNISFDRIRHNRSVAKAFAEEASRSDLPPPDLILACVPNLELTEQAINYGQRKGIPVVVDVEDEWPDLYLSAFPSRFRGLGRVVLGTEFRRVKYILKSASAIFACSQTYLQWALDYAQRPKQENDEVFVLGYVRPENSLDNNSETWRTKLQSEYGIPKDGFVVTFLGQFGASYDLETVIEAARILNANNGVPIQFVLAGDGDKSSRLRHQARGLTNVFFTGWLDQAAMIALMGMSSIGLAAYTDRALQSLPYKPFEYMAAGLPIISSLRGECETLLHEEKIGMHYDAGNPASLADCVKWFSTHAEMRAQMGKRALELFEERFSTDVIYPRFVDQLVKIAGK